MNQYPKASRSLRKRRRKKELSFENLEPRRLLAGLDGSEVIGLPDDMISKAYVFIGDHSGSNSEKWDMSVGGRTHSAPDYGDVQRDRRDFKKGESYPVTVQHAGTNRSQSQGPDYDYRAWVDRYARPSWTSGSPTPSGAEFFVVDSQQLFQRRFFSGPGASDPTLGKSATLHFPSFDLDVDTDDDNGKEVPSDNVGEDNREIDNHFGKLIQIYDSDLDMDGLQDTFDFDGIASARFVPISLRLSANLADADLQTVEIQFDYNDASTTNQNDSGLMRIWSKDAHETRDSSSDFYASGSRVDVTSELTPGSSVTFYIEGVNESNRTTLFDEIKATVFVNGYEWSGELEDIIHVRTDEVLDLGVDSNNDGQIDEDDDAIEDDSSEPGKVILANLLDHTANNVPDYADGISRFGNEGANRSQDFSEAKLQLPESVNLNDAFIKFGYSAADPSLVEFDNSTGDYSTGSSNPVRLWLKQGSESRNHNSLQDGGDFLAADYEYDLADLLDGSQSRELTFYVEGISESDLGDVVISVSVDPDGDGQKGYIFNDQVRMSVAHIQVVYTDVSGITGTANVDRIDASEEADGVTADWQDGVEDGSLLLMSLVSSKFVQDMIDEDSSTFQFDFGHYDSTAFQTGLTDNDGVFVELTDAGFFADSQYASADAALSDLSISKVGEEFRDTGQYVVDARFYRPPFEHNHDEVSGPGGQTRKYRQLPLQMEVSGMVDSSGGKPHAITLARPAVVTVHGINSNPSTWNEFMFRVDRGENRGFHAEHFSVDHSGVDPNRQSEGVTYGNGELSSMYERVPDMIDHVLAGFREGEFDYEEYGSNDISLFSREGHDDRKLKIAVQKTDIVAHSYGGLLSRWYIEQAPDANGTAGGLFNERRDVRKLVTLGTPHKGSPFANVVAETFKDGLIAEGYNNGTYGVGQFTMRWLVRNLPGVHTEAADGSVRHSYQVLSVNSDILNTLNTNPFHDDVAYGAIRGTDINFHDPVLNSDIDLYAAFQPISDVDYNHFNRYLWPWLKIMNPGNDATDSIVPTWSARLGSAASNNSSVEANHTDLPSDYLAIANAQIWLDNSFSLVLGSDLRGDFSGDPPVSHRNAYVGSTFAGGVNTGAGLNRDAIVKVELDPTDASAAYGVYTFGSADPADEGRLQFKTDAASAGARANAMTGMIQWKHRDQLQLKLVSDELIDNELHDMGTLNESQLNFKAADKVGIDDDDWIAFRVTEGKIGRRQDQVLTGPDGVGGWDDPDQYVAYHLAVDGGTTQAPAVSGHTRVMLEEFSLATPTKAVTPAGWTLSFSGGITAQNTAAGTQRMFVKLYDEDVVVDDLMVNGHIDLTHGANTWDGLLVPFSGQFSVFVDINGNIAGTHGSSGENEAEAYVYLLDDGDGASNTSSDVIKVP